MKMSEFDTQGPEFAEINSDSADNYVKRSLYTCYFLISYYLMAQIIIILVLAIGGVLLFVTLAVWLVKTRANIRNGKLDLNYITPKQLEAVQDFMIGDRSLRVRNSQ